MKVVYLFGAIILLSCQDKPNQPKVTITKDVSSFTMYEMSEMASLMEQMYVDNQRLKQKIENNELDFGEFPDYYLKIHTATFTDPSDLDDFFKINAQRFIETQRIVYTDTANAKTNFNNAVNACLDCHTVKCTFSIGRIKRLYIK